MSHHQTMQSVCRPVFAGRQVQVRSTPKPVTPFGGLVSLISFCERIGLARRISEGMPFAYASNNAIPPAQTLVAFLVSVVAGARRFAHTDWLRADKALHALLGIGHFPGTDTVRNLFKRFRQGHIEAFWRPLWKWLLGLSWPVPADGFSLDLDSTVFQRSGHQEGAKKGYNPARPGRHSHHPLLAFLAEAPLVLHAWLRSGNTGTARGAVAFLTEALALMPAAWKLRCVPTRASGEKFLHHGLLEGRVFSRRCSNVASSASISVSISAMPKPQIQRRYSSRLGTFHSICCCSLMRVQFANIVFGAQSTRLRLSPSP